MASDSSLTESTWAIWFSCMRSTRDWPPGSDLCLLPCSWSDWQLLEEVPCNSRPATGVPLSAGAWDVSALPDTLQDCTHMQRALLCCSTRAAGAGGSQALGTRLWQEQTLKELLSGRKSSLLARCCLCLGGFCWCGCQDFAEDVHSFQSNSKRHPSWEAKEALPSLQKQRQCLG